MPCSLSVRCYRIGTVCAVLLWLQYSDTLYAVISCLCANDYHNCINGCRICARLFLPKVSERRMIDEAERPENKLKGKFLDVGKGAATTHVEIDIGGGVVTAPITNESGRRT